METTKLNQEMRERLEDLSFRAELNALDYRDALADIVRYGSSWKGVDNMSDQELIDYLKEHFEQHDQEELQTDEDFLFYQSAVVELLMNQTINDSEAV